MVSVPGAPAAPAPSRAVAGALAGLVAGAAAGLIDGLWTLGRAEQFVPTLVGRLRFLLYLAVACGALGAVVGVVWRGACALLCRTAPAIALRGLADERATKRTRDPRDALAPFALALVGAPVVAGSLIGGYLLAVRALASRNHVGLIIAVSMAVAVAALVVGTGAATVLARPVEALLRRLGPGAARTLSAPRAPWLAVGALLAIAAVVVAIAARNVLAALPLRPGLVALLLLGLFPAAARATAGPAARLAARRTRVQVGAAVGGIVLLLALVCMLGAPTAIAKAADAASGLGAPIARALRAVVDLDRDGASPLLGGGDCDDLDAAVHPGATEIPDDGRDNNCVGGDVVLGPPHDPGFVPVPAAVPVDFDVLLVTIDTLRADHVGAYGYARPTTPALDKLAAEGALFVNGWAHAPSTRYSMPAILTGRLPLEVDYAEIKGAWPGLTDANTTIAEVLSARGFTAGAVTNYGYFDKVRRMDQGFARYDNSNKRLHGAIPGEGPARSRGSSSKEQTDKALEIYDQLGDGRRFLWVHYYDPHADYEKHSGQFGDRDLDRYDDEIRYADDHIGRLFAEIARRRRWDRTVVVVTGDHGEGFGEHGVDHHGYHLYAAQTKVPLIIRVPGLPPSRPTVPAGHVDILATLANLAGATPPTGLDGDSLLDALAGGAQATRERAVFQELSYENHHEMRAAADARCHVIYNISPAASWEVYRIDRDPAETQDLSGDPGPCGATVDALARFVDRQSIPRAAARPPRPATP